MRARWLGLVVSLVLVGCTSSTVPKQGKECALSVEKVEVPATGGLTTNCYLVFDSSSKEALVIDPGGEREKIQEQLKKKGLRATGILLTHGHWDHTGAAKELQSSTGAVVYAHRHQPSTCELMNCSLEGIEIKWVDEGSPISVGCKDIQIHHTPGHSPGSITAYLEKEGMAFTGDFLFAGSVGRTDFPGGDWQVLKRQLARLVRILPPDTRIFPGHGEETTLAHELKTNRFLEDLEGGAH